MNKGLRKFLILLIVFVAALFGFSKLTNHEPKDLTTDLARAQLPLLYLEDNGISINELHGYTKQMNPLSMRDTITPVSADGILPVTVNTFGEEVSGISFEIRSLDNTKQIAKAEAQNFKSEKNTVSAEIQTNNLLEDNTEYLLTLNVDTSDHTVHYYTRLEKAGESHIQECLEFVQQIHQYTKSQKTQSKLVGYMEPSLDSDNSTLQKVTINNSLEQICWADFKGEEVSAPSVSVKEMGDSGHVILLNYVMTSKDQDEKTQYYNVEEYYRVRYNGGKIYLLNFERTMEEIFRGEGNEIQKDTLMLGIRSGDIAYKSNEAGNILCFEQQGELWSYNRDENALTRVFSFRESNDVDARENYDEHDIQIIQTDESGSIDFVVYGYMNRGDHEGEVGISVCHYDSVKNTVEEMLFLPSDSSYQIMKEQLGERMYLADNSKFYLILNGALHQIDTDSKEDKILIQNLDAENYQVSEDGQYLAWTEYSDKKLSGTLHFMDLESGAVHELKMGTGKVVWPLGFMGSDCIYGVGRQSDQTEKGVHALYEMQIVSASDEKSEVLKTYRRKGYYITSAKISDGTIYLNRVRKKGGAYVSASSDSIVNRDMQQQDLVTVETTRDGDRQMVEQLKMSETVSGASAKLVIPSQIIPEKSTTMKVKEMSGKQSDYYVYAKGKVYYAGSDVAKAVQVADENKGVVVNRNLACIWNRAKKQKQSGIVISGAKGSSAKVRALSAIVSINGGSVSKTLLSGKESVDKLLAKALPDRTIYNLTGCSVDQMLYFVGQGSPVYAQDANGNPVLLVGYDDNYVRIYDAGTGKSHSELIRKATQNFEKSGNVFYCVQAS